MLHCALADRFAGTVLFTFDDFTARVAFRSDHTLSLEIVDGESAGFTDEVCYQEHAVRDDVVVLSWQEHVGSAVTQVIDLAAARTYATVAPVSGGFLRLHGTVRAG